MFGQTSGLTFWAAAMLILEYASANPAILISGTEAGYYDVSLNITSLALLPGLQEWDDLAFTALEEPLVSVSHGDIDLEMWEMLAVIDMGAGQLCQYQEGCTENIAELYHASWDAEEENAEALGLPIKENRYCYIYRRISFG